MNQKLLEALISGGGAFLGAMLGFIGGWITSKRTLHGAKEQRRYDLVRDKRGEILPEICMRLSDLTADFRRLVSVPFRPLDGQGQLNRAGVAEFVDRRRAATKQLIGRVTELGEYHKRNAIWIPTDLAESINGLIDQVFGTAERYSEQLPKLFESAKDSADRVAGMRRKVEKVEETDRRYSIKHETGSSAAPSLLEEGRSPLADERFDEQFLATVEGIFGKEAAEKFARGEKPQTEDVFKGRTSEEIRLYWYLDGCLSGYTHLRDVICDWLDGEVANRWSHIYRRSREVLDVDDRI